MARSTVAPTRLDFGVVKPITIEKPGEYDWHAWRREPHGDVWLGFFKDDKVALEWAKTQNCDITVNNVPPPTSRAYITGDYKWGDFTDGKEIVRPRREVSGGKTFTPSTTKRVAPPRKTQPTRSTPRKADRVREVYAPKVESAAEKAMKQDAAKIVTQHKADEARDIAEGKAESA